MILFNLWVCVCGVLNLVVGVTVGLVMYVFLCLCVFCILLVVVCVL